MFLHVHSDVGIDGTLYIYRRSSFKELNEEHTEFQAPIAIHICYV